SPILATVASSPYGIPQPPRSNPSRVSSSGRPGPCITRRASPNSTRLPFPSHLLSSRSRQRHQVCPVRKWTRQPMSTKTLFRGKEHARHAVAALIGREQETQVLEDLAGNVRERGGALVVRGEAGIGKSVLLAAAGDRAKTRGMLTLKTVGVQSEAHLAFAGLHQLLRPILAGVDK